MFHLTNSPAKAWRVSLNLTREELSALTGYSPEAIYLFERGTNSKNERHAAEAVRRYKAACLAVTILKHYKQESLDAWEWTK